MTLNKRSWLYSPMSIGKDDFFSNFSGHLYFSLLKLIHSNSRQLFSFFVLRCDFLFPSDFWSCVFDTGRSNWVTSLLNAFVSCCLWQIASVFGLGYFCFFFVFLSIRLRFSIEILTFVKKSFVLKTSNKLGSLQDSTFSWCEMYRQFAYLVLTIQFFF